MKKFLLYFLVALFSLQLFVPLYPSQASAQAGTFANPQDTMNASTERWLLYKGLSACINDMPSDTYSRGSINAFKWGVSDSTTTIGYVSDGKDGHISCGDSGFLSNAVQVFGVSTGVDFFCLLNKYDNSKYNVINPSNSDCPTSSTFAITQNIRLYPIQLVRKAAEALSEPIPFDASGAMQYWIARRALEVFCGGGQSMADAGKTSVELADPKVVATNYVDPDTGTIKAIHYDLDSVDENYTVKGATFVRGTASSADRKCYQLADDAQNTAKSFSQYVITQQWQDIRNTLRSAVIPPSDEVKDSECGPAPNPNNSALMASYSSCVDTLTKKLDSYINACTGTDPSAMLFPDPMSYGDRFKKMRDNCVGILKKFGKGNLKPETLTSLLGVLGNISPNTTDDATGDSKSADDSAAANSCGIESDLAWIVCPITGGLAQFAKFLGDVIGKLLYVDPNHFFTGALKKAWGTFRNLGIALILIAGLVMVISQALGLEILDAYTIRKLMPRLGVALIGMALSWPLLKVGVTFFNDLGIWAHDLIMGPFKGLGYNVGVAESLINGMIERSIVGAAGIVTVVAATVLGYMGVLSLLGTIVLGLFIGLLVLSIRQAVIMTAILLAPLAIAAYVLPGTQKLWKFWKDTLITSLVMFPIIMAFLAGGEALSRIMMSTDSGGNDKFINIMATIVFFAPYFLLPFAFKLAGGLMSTIFSLANDKSRGVFDRLRNFRGNTMKKRWGEYQTGLRGKNFVGRSVGDLAVASRALGDAGIGLSGLLDKDGMNRARTKYSEQHIMEALRNNSLAWTADDSANAAFWKTQGKGGKSAYLAMYVKTARDNGDDETPTDVLHQKAEQAYGDILAGIGAAEGTRALEVATWKSQQYSKTGYGDKDDDVERRQEDTREAVRRGYVNKNEAGAWQKQSQRISASQVSYSDWLKIIDGGYYDKAGNWNSLEGAEGVGFALDSALNYMNPTALASARKEDIEVLTNRLKSNIEGALGRGDLASLAKSMAQFSGMRDVLNQTQPYLADIFAKNLAEVTLQGTSGPLTIDVPEVTVGAETVQTKGVATTSSGKEAISGKETTTQSQGSGKIVIGGGTAPAQPIGTGTSSEARTMAISIRRLEDALKNGDQNILGKTFGEDAGKVLSAWLDRRREWGSTDIVSRGAVPPDVAAALADQARRAGEQTPPPPTQPLQPGGPSTGGFAH